ncbi:DUF4129 domain-containing protein [Micromonospora sp. NPDC048999]|uniref:DUF4129 domain-containing protein n=1 Tax=Micromonospora sp. NPDC048999 TaxID=3155391 RepID=UPI0033C86E24
MIRWWNELVARLADVVPGGVPMLVILSFLATLLVAALWYWWPAWLPTRRSGRRGRRRDRKRSDRRSGRRRFRLGRLRFRFRWPWRRRRAAPAEASNLAEDQLPDVPAAVLALSADQLAAAGRFKEAVRERLRAMVRDLVERQVIAAVPGWTVTELAWAAGQARPPVAAPLRAASGLFSEIWYGFRPATVEDDGAMRGWAEQVRALLDAEPAARQPGDPAGRPPGDPAGSSPAEVSR